MLILTQNCANYDVRFARQSGTGLLRTRARQLRRHPDNFCGSLVQCIASTLLYNFAHLHFHRTSAHYLQRIVLDYKIIWPAA